MEATGEDKDCCVKVAVHIRPLIGDEKLQGCKDCVTVVSGKPQVQSHSTLSYLFYLKLCDKTHRILLKEVYSFFFSLIRSI